MYAEQISFCVREAKEAFNWMLWLIGKVMNYSYRTLNEEGLQLLDLLMKVEACELIPRFTTQNMRSYLVESI